MKVGFLHILLVVFVTLKLTDVVDWSWLLVLSPGLVMLLVYAFLGMAYTALVAKTKR